MVIDVERLSLQVGYILAEHYGCNQKCLGDRKLDLDQHREYLSNLIAYYALGMDTQWDT